MDAFDLVGLLEKIGYPLLPRGCALGLEGGGKGVIVSSWFFPSSVVFLKMGMGGEGGWEMILRGRGRGSPEGKLARGGCWMRRGSGGRKGRMVVLPLLWRRRIGTRGGCGG